MKAIIPSWFSDKCCDKLFETLTCCLCFCCIICCCITDLHVYISIGFRLIYKTGFYFYNIFFISTIIIYYCYDSNIIIEQKRITWVFYVIVSFLVIDIFSFIHVIIYGKKINAKRNSLFGLFGFLISYFIYLTIFGKKESGYLLIPTAYYYLINNYLIILVKEKWRVGLYPLYVSVGYFFVFLAIPIILLGFAILIFNKCGEYCCNSRTERRSSMSSNNTPPPPVQREESYDNNYDNENN